jgi:hypothetical protein
MLLLIAAIGVGLATALISLNWFFASGEETDSSMAEWERPYMPWWGGLSSAFGSRYQAQPAA